jgi:hypothetical protein
MSLKRPYNGSPGIVRQVHQLLLSVVAKLLIAVMLNLFSTALRSLPKYWQVKRRLWVL